LPRRWRFQRRRSSGRSAASDELAQAFALRRTVSPPSSREGGFDLDTAYAVESELRQLRRTAGHKTIGRKVGLANKAVWRVMKLETLASAIARSPDQEPLVAGELVSSGTLTEGQLIHADETWSAQVEGIALAPLTVTVKN
jgi:2-keto-4-pentenoate hydratase